MPPTYRWCSWEKASLSLTPAVQRPQIEVLLSSGIHTNCKRLFLVQPILKFILNQRMKGTIRLGPQIPSLWFWEVRKVLKGWGKAGGPRSVDFRKGWRVRGTAGEPVQFPDRLGKWLATRHVSHPNIKSLILGMIFSILMKKSLSKGDLEKGFKCPLDLSRANQFLICGSWVLSLVPATDFASLCVFAFLFLFLMSSACFVRGYVGENTKKLVTV